MMFVESVFFVFLVYFILFLISYKKCNEMEMMSSYECGFEIKSITRVMFSYRFFLVSILFLVFDVEIVLMLPVPFFKQMNVFLLFVLILLLGLLYEYACGSLNWL